MAARQQPQPSAWDASIRSSAQRYLSVDGCRVKYIGPGSEDKDAAAVRSNHPVPSDCPIFYFEVEIASRGRDGFIGEPWTLRAAWSGGRHGLQGVHNAEGRGAVGCVRSSRSAQPLSCLPHTRAA